MVSRIQLIAKCSLYIDQTEHSILMVADVKNVLKKLGDLSIIIVAVAIVLWIFKETLERDSEENSEEQCCRRCIAYRFIVFSLLIL